MKKRRQKTPGGKRGAPMINTEAGKKPFRAHQKELANLAQSDPSFFNYLKENDPALLDFQVTAGNEPAESENEKESRASPKGQLSEVRRKGKKRNVATKSDNVSEHSRVGNFNLHKKKMKVAAEGGFVNERIHCDADTELMQESDEMQQFQLFEKELGSDENESSVNSEMDVPGIELNSLKSKEVDVVEVSETLLKLWEQALLEKNCGMSLKRLVLSFKAAAYLGEAEEHSLSYHVGNSSVFNKLLIFCLNELPGILMKLLFPGGTGQKKDSTVLPSSSTKWSRFKSTIHIFLSSCIHFLEKLADGELSQFVLQSVCNSILFFACFRGLCRNLLKLLLRLWVSGGEKTRILAFVNVRELSCVAPTFLESCLKQSYLTYVRNAKFVVVGSQNLIQFMCNCFVELCGHDPNVSYTIGFVYIREMSIILRRAIQRKNKETVGVVLGWQFLNCLRIWMETLRAYPKQSVLQALNYPLVQIAMGILELSQGLRYCGVSFIISKFLLDLSEATGLFINPVPYLLPLLQSPEMKRIPKASGDTECSVPVDWNVTLKLSKKLFGSRDLQASVSEQLVLLLLRFFVLHAYSPAFPELAIPAVLTFKSYLKEMHGIGARSTLAMFLKKLEENSLFVAKHRRSVEFGPSDFAACSEFLKEERSAQKAPLVVYFNQPQTTKMPRTPKIPVAKSQSSVRRFRKRLQRR